MSSETIVVYGHANLFLEVYGITELYLNGFLALQVDQGG